jgi:hypothetical protein
MKRSDLRKRKEAMREHYTKKREAQRNGESDFEVINMVFSGNREMWIPEARKEKHRCSIVPYMCGKVPTRINKRLHKVAPGLLTYCYRYVMHRNVGPEKNGNMLCLKSTYGRYCRCCEDLDVLRKAYEKNKELIDSIKWKNRVAWNVLPVSDPDIPDVIHIWDLPYVTGKHKGWAEQIDDRAEDPDTERYDDETGMILFWDYDERGREVSFTQNSRKKEDLEFARITDVVLKKRDYSVEKYMDQAYVIEDLASNNFIWKNDEEVDWAATEQKFIEFYEGENVEFENNDPETKAEPERETIEMKSDKKMPWDEDDEKSGNNDEQISELRKLNLEAMDKEQLLALVKKYSILCEIKNPEDMDRDALWDVIDDVII